jgi:hypothetical protein
MLVSRELKEKGVDMAAQSIDVFRVEIDDKPGALQGLLSGVSDAGLNIFHMAAFSCGGGKGMAYFVPDKPEGLEEFASSRDLTLEKLAGFLLSGVDKVGVGAAVTKPLSEAGVNMLVGSATVSQGEYYLMIVVSQEDAEKAAAALGA